MNRILTIGFSSAATLLQGMTVTYRLLFRLLGQKPAGRACARKGRGIA